MKLREFIQKLLFPLTSLDTEVRIDASMPIPFEDVYEIVQGKGYILLRKHVKHKDHDTPR